MSAPRAPRTLGLGLAEHNITYTLNMAPDNKSSHEQLDAELLLGWLTNLEYRLTKLERSDMTDDLDGFARRQAHELAMFMTRLSIPEKDRPELTEEYITTMMKHFDSITNDWQRILTHGEDPRDD